LLLGLLLSLLLQLVSLILKAELCNVSFDAASVSLKRDYITHHRWHGRVSSHVV
jgi:hypothetical protein